jgi:hypothetical protein
VIEEEDKGALTRRRVELVESLTMPLSVEDRVRIQGELRVVNAKIKAVNTTEAAQLKAAADRRRVAGMVEARANAARAQAKHKSTWPSSAPGDPGFGDPINRESIEQREAKITQPNGDEDDPGQTAAIDAWIEAVLKRGGVRIRRASDGNLDLIDAPAKWVAIVDALCSGIYAAARGQELPEVTAAPKEKRKTRR